MEEKQPPRGIMAAPSLMPGYGETTASVNFLNNSELSGQHVSTSLTNLKRSLDRQTSLDLEISSLCADLSLSDHDDRSQPSDSNGTSDAPTPIVTFLPTSHVRCPTPHVSPAPSETFLHQNQSNNAQVHTFVDQHSSIDSVLFSEGSPKLAEEPPQRENFMPNREFDVASMRQKLSAEKDLLSKSFKSPPRLPAEFASHDIISPPSKPGCLKIKHSLWKVGKAAKRFLHQNIMKRQKTRLQRCEVHLTGLPEDADQVFVIISKTCSGVQTCFTYFPAYLASPITIPKCLLSGSSREELSITVLAVTIQSKGSFQGFSKVCASGRCNIKTVDKALATVTVQLHHHNPSCALTGQVNSQMKSTCSVEVTHTSPTQYKFEVKPLPIATDFTELLVLQTAEPFQEFFSLSSSTCEKPAVTTADLEQGKYYSSSAFRLTRGDLSGVFAIHSASSATFFKACLDKAGKAQECRRAARIFQGAQDMDPLPVSQLLLAKTADFHAEDFLKVCHEKQADLMKNLLSEIRLPKFLAKPKSADDAANTTSDCLHFSVCENNTGLQGLANNSHSFIQVPPLTVFNMNTALYFADFWDYYGKPNVTLLLCTKGSPADKYCKENLCKLDPYKNPFLFRRRVLFPEACVQVFVARNLQLEILYMDSANVEQHILFCSKNLYFSKVKVEAK